MTSFKELVYLKISNLNCISNACATTYPLHSISYHRKCIFGAQTSSRIEKVNEPTTWLNSVVPVQKSNGGTQICLDMQQANQAIIEERHVIPKIEDILAELHGAKCFTKIDMREGYHQILLEESTRHLTTFATHEALVMIFSYGETV